MLFLELLYLHQLIRYLCRCFFLLIYKNMHPQLAFSLFCRYSPSKICIHNLPFLYLADTPLQKFASATCFFSILQILSFKNLHPQLAFSLSCRYSPAKICIRNLFFLYLADTPLQKFASATCSFSILQILPCKNLHPQLAFSLSCRYSTLQYTLLLNYSGFLLNYYFDF